MLILLIRVDVHPQIILKEVADIMDALAKVTDDLNLPLPKWQFVGHANKTWDPKKGIEAEHISKKRADACMKYVEEETKGTLVDAEANT